MSHRPTRAARRRGVSDDEVFDAVVELSNHYRAPSTSLIVWQLAAGGFVTAPFQTAVRDALHRLHAGGRLARVTHRGTGRWSATPEHGQEGAADDIIIRTS